MSRNGRRADAGKIKAEVVTHGGKWMVRWTAGNSTLALTHEEPTEDAALAWMADLLKSNKK